MYRNDKITDCIEVISPGDASASKPDYPFYLFLSPKNEQANKVAILECKTISGDKGEKRVPIVPNEWNPVVLSSVSIDSETLRNYNVFIGTEG